MTTSNDTSTQFRVLVVDDDVDFASCVVEALGMDGCDVAWALTAADACRIASESRLDAVLLDVTLPDANGYALARELRGNGLEALTPIVMLTGMPPRELGPSDPPEVDMTLSKPTELDRLSSLLRHLQGLRKRGVRPSAH